MATVYGLPEGFEPPAFEDFIGPDGRYDREKDDQLHRDFIESLREWVKTHRVGAGDLMGEVVRFPIADGYAQYMIVGTKPAALMHLPIHDAWEIPEAHARGLRTSDLRDEIMAEKRFAELFARKG